MVQPQSAPLTAWVAVAWCAITVIAIGVVVPVIQLGLVARRKQKWAEFAPYIGGTGAALIVLGACTVGLTVHNASGWVMPLSSQDFWITRGLVVGWALCVAGYCPGAVKHWLGRLRRPDPPDLQMPLEVSAMELYKIAADTRKFELDLFWKRSGFFWGFLALTLGGYVAAKEPGQRPIRLMLAHVGLVEAFCWWLVNRGSKYWHENWEQMVRLLEGKRGIFTQTAKIDPKGPLGAAPFSVSRITIFFSLCTVWLFMGLSIRETVEPYIKPGEFLADAWPFLLAGFTATILGYVYFAGTSGSAGGAPDHAKQDAKTGPASTASAQRVPVWKQSPRM